MTQIDWSKAPADATHCHPRAGGYTNHWIKPGHFCVVGFEAKGWVSDFGHPAMKLAIPRPITWNGEGAPPTGILLEVKLKGTRTDWCPATVLFCQDDALVIAWKAEGVARPTALSAVDIRPIRTAEQIAAEEREKGITGIVNASASDDRPGITRMHAAAIYDAGARMPGDGPKA